MEYDVDLSLEDLLRESKLPLEEVYYAALAYIKDYGKEHVIKFRAFDEALNIGLKEGVISELDIKLQEAYNFFNRCLHTLLRPETPENSNLRRGMIRFFRRAEERDPKFTCRDESLRRLYVLLNCHLDQESMPYSISSEMSKHLFDDLEWIDYMRKHYEANNSSS